MGASGAHSVFKRNSKGSVVKYETYSSQSNPKDPKPWESIKRYDGPGSDPHFNKTLGQYIESPHVHDPHSPGGIRPPAPWEIPK